jgi:hypothetical protein
MKTDHFIRRSAPKSETHRCHRPAWRWLPFIVYPRWFEGARWQCHCGAIYEYQWDRSGYDHELIWVKI